MLILHSVHSENDIASFVDLNFIRHSKTCLNYVNANLLNTSGTWGEKMTASGKRTSTGFSELSKLKSCF